jgi:hypothetical protein
VLGQRRLRAEHALRLDWLAVTSAALRIAVLSVALGAASCRAKEPPCPNCPETCATTTPSSTTPAPSATPSASASAATAGSPLPDEDENRWCKKGFESYGTWMATPEEVFAAAQKLTSACAPKEWLVYALRDCMQRLDQSNVSVMSGVMSGDRWTTYACNTTSSSVEWQGRRWIEFYQSIRDGAAVFDVISAVEMTPKGPVVVTHMCQGSPTARTGQYRRPPPPSGWKTFPDDLKARLCAP